MPKDTGGRNAYITGIGSFLPGDPIPFSKFEEVLGAIPDVSPKTRARIDRTREAMRELLGIQFSHYAVDPRTGKPTETNLSMAVKASRKALEQACIQADQIELIVYAGVFFDCLCPPMSALVQGELQIPYCAEMVIHSNCTAIYKALQVASDLISCGRYKNALVVSSQLSSAFLRGSYYNPAKVTLEHAILRWFLSDAAGAVVLQAEPGDRALFRVTDTYLESVGADKQPAMTMLLGTTDWNPSVVYETGLHHLTQDLSSVSKIAPRLEREGIDRMLEKTGVDVSRIKCFLANIPTKHILDLYIEARREQLGIPELPIYTKLSERGYPGVPALVVGLDEYAREASLDPGDLVMSFVTESSKWMHAGFILECCQQLRPRS